MAKQYTAEEMREVAEQIDDECADAIADERTIASEFDVDTAQTLRDMLRQAADALEREEREKRYEYSIKNPNGNIMKTHEDEMFPIMPLICKVVRREIGEWDEVPNEG